MTDTITGFTVTDSIEPDSSLVAYAAWDASTDTLGLVFHNREDDAYLYNVAPEIWKAFKNARSQGSYYNSYIKSYYGPGTVVDAEAVRPPVTEPTPPVLPAVGTRVNVKTVTGVDGQGTVTAFYKQNGFDLMVDVDNLNTMPVYLSEVSPIETIDELPIESGNPFDADGDRSFVVLLEVTVNESTGAGQAVDWLYHELDQNPALVGALEVLSVNETIPE